MSNLIRIGGGGGGSAPTLITKSITQNGTYNAIDDNADGYSEVEVDVEGGGEESVIGEVIMLTSNNPFVQNTGITGTDVANVARSWTFDKAGTLKFAPTTYGRTNTGSNEGFYDIQLNGVSVVKQYLTTGVDTSITVDDIPVSVGDTLDIVYGFDNYHSRCDFTFYGAISLVTLIPKYVDLSSFAHYYKRNTTTPTITSISSTEVSLTFQDQNATGYELCSFSVPLTKGIYVAEIKATVDKNTGLANQYTWGIYSATTTGGAQENSADVKSKGYTTYVPFDRSDTAEHTYEVPINVTADGTAYICFAMADDNGVNATVTVSSLKIRKACGVESGGSKQISYLKWRITNTRSNPSASALQLSEFYLYLNDVLYNWNSNVSISASLGATSANESIDHIIDGSVDTKYVTTQWGGSYVGQCDIVIALGETITVDNNTSYAYATGDDEPSRDPVGWALWGSSDGSNWFVLDAKDNASVPTERKTSTDKFSITV